MDWTIIIGIAIGVFAGVPFGVLIMGIMAGRAYEKGRSDEAKWIYQEQR
jgi:hypothetical protein